MKSYSKESIKQFLITCPRPSSNLSQFTLLILIFLFLFPSAYANIPACKDIFQNGLQASRGDGYVRFHYDSRLIDPSSNNLLSPDVDTNLWSTIKSCGENHCSDGGGPGPRLYADPLKTTSSMMSTVVPAHTKKTLGQTNHEFSSVQISEWATAEFSSAHKEYIIDTLEMSLKSTLRLPSGTYWIKNLKLEVDGRIDVLGEGTVTIFVGSPLTVPLNFRINEASKNPAKFAIYSYNNLTFYVGSKTYAFSQAEDWAFVHYNAYVVGGIIARNLELLEQSQVKYDALAAQQLNVNDLCKSL